MKISQIVCSYPPYRGGIGNAAFNFTQQLIRLGHDVCVFTPKYAKQQKSKLSLQRLRPVIKWGNAAWLPQLPFYLSSFDINVLHYPFFGANEGLAIWQKFTRKKLIIHYHMDTGELPIFTKILSLPSVLTQKFLFTSAALIICSSFDYVKTSSIKKIYQKTPSKFLELPFGVDIDKFYPRQKSTKIKNILFVGGLDKAHYFKGVDVLLQAVSKLINNNWHLKIIGQGDLLEYYKKLAQKLSISDKVEFFSDIDNASLAREYRMSDLFVLPSINTHEAFGIVLLEAMSSGLALVASNLPGVRSVFKNKQQGLLAEPNNADDLCAKISTILFDERLLKQMQKNSRTMAKNNYSWNVIGLKYEQALKKIAKK